MLYVSLPVHEKPEVIVNQMQNFARFLPEAKIVLHISKDALFSIGELISLFKDENILNGLINPVQVETHWGSIIQAHLENIRYIIKQGDAEKVIFHASNDMLVMDGLSDYLRDKKNIFHLRKCTEDSLWWVARRAVQDKEVYSFFNGNIYASQIEGAMYDIRILEKLLDCIECNELNLNSPIFYPREEIVFSSFSYKINISSDGLPYIYSEVHDFDRVLFRYLNKVRRFRFSVLDKVLNFFLSIIVRLVYKMHIDEYKIKDIITRSNTLDSLTTLYDNDTSSWIIYDKFSLFGVKRVERDLKNSIRILISNQQ